MEFKKLNLKSYLFVFMALTFILVIISIITDRLWYEEISTLLYRDQVQKEYGLTLKKTKYWYNKSTGYITCYYIDSLAPEGKAEVLGFRKGDIPISLGSHGPFLPEGYFYSWLTNSDNNKGSSRKSVGEKGSRSGDKVLINKGKVGIKVS